MLPLPLKQKQPERTGTLVRFLRFYRLGRSADAASNFQLPLAPEGAPHSRHFFTAFLSAGQPFPANFRFLLRNFRYFSTICRSGLRCGRLPSSNLADSAVD